MALDVDRTARDGEIRRGSDLVSQATPFSASCETGVGYHPTLTRWQANAVEFATKVCFSHFDGSEVLAQLTSCTKGKLCKCRILETCDSLSIQIYMRRWKLRLLANSCYALWQLRLPEGKKIPVQGCRLAFLLAHIFLLITSYKSSIFLYTLHFLTYLRAVKPLLSVQHGTRGCPYLRKCPQLRNNKYNMYIVFCHVPLKAKSRHLASLEKPEKGEATRCKHCGCLLNTQVMHCDCHT